MVLLYVDVILNVILQSKEAAATSKLFSGQRYEKYLTGLQNRMFHFVGFSIIYILGSRALDLGCLEDISILSYSLLNQ